MSKFKSNGVDVPAATGKAYARILGYEGDDETSAVPAEFPVSLTGTVGRYYLPVGETVLTLAILRAGIITSINPTSSTLLLPTFATLGWTRDADAPIELFLPYQVCGDGGFFINPAVGVTIQWNDFDPQYLLANTPPHGLVTTGDNTWAAC